MCNISVFNINLRWWLVETSQHQDTGKGWVDMLQYPGGGQTHRSILIADWGYLTISSGRAAHVRVRGEGGETSQYRGEGREEYLDTGLKGIFILVLETIKISEHISVHRRHSSTRFIGETYSVWNSVWLSQWQNGWHLAACKAATRSDQEETQRSEVR